MHVCPKPNCSFGWNGLYKTRTGFVVLPALNSLFSMLKYNLTKLKGCFVLHLKSNRPSLCWSKSIRWMDPWWISFSSGKLSLDGGTEQSRQGLFHGVGGHVQSSCSTSSLVLLLHCDHWEKIQATAAQCTTGRILFQKIRELLWGTIFVLLFLRKNKADHLSSSTKTVISDTVLKKENSDS